ncbi:MAG: histidine phosphatase family protein [Bacteroidota bacterium]
MSKLFFFRHAQASFLANNYDQLSQKGEQQSLALANYLVHKKITFDKIFVGPLKRQQHTFEIVADLFSKNKINVPAPVQLAELKEHAGTEAMGDALPILIEKNPQIKKWSEEIIAKPALKRRNSLLIFQYFMDEWATGSIEIKNFEPWANFRKEVKKGLDNILANTGRGETVGIFTSGGTISSITAEALNIQDEKKVAAMNFSVRNTSFTTFLFSKNKFNLLSFNELPHLDEELITFV